MSSYIFTAYALDGEIDLNKVAAALDVSKRFKWEDPLVLCPATLEMYQGAVFDEQRVYLYYFGAAVFYNCSEEVIARFYKDISRATETFRIPKSLIFREGYSLQVNEQEKMAITNDCLKEELNSI